MPDPFELECQAVLFDLDGVLVDSRRCVELVWRQWGQERGRDPEPFIRMAHGRRTSETIELIAPEMDARAEARVLDRMEEECTEGLDAIPGALELIRSIPLGRWGVVTSGHRPVATLRLTSVGIPLPPVLVTGDQVTRGKPDPEPYLTGLERMGRCPEECVVFEDAPPGIASAQAAGLRVIALGTTHRGDALASAEYQVDDFRAVRAEVVSHGAKIQLLKLHVRSQASIP